MPAGRLFSLHVVARLRDFFDERTHWQRRLWNVGLVLSLQELLEAAEERDRALSSAAVSNLVDSVRTHIAWDPGGGTDLERSALARYVGGNLAVGGLSYEGIRVALARSIRTTSHTGRQRFVRAKIPRTESARHGRSDHISSTQVERLPSLRNGCAHSCRCTVRSVRPIFAMRRASFSARRGRRSRCCCPSSSSLDSRLRDLMRGSTQQRQHVGSAQTGIAACDSAAASSSASKPTVPKRRSAEPPMSLIASLHAFRSERGPSADLPHAPTCQMARLRR